MPQLNIQLPSEGIPYVSVGRGWSRRVVTDSVHGLVVRDGVSVCAATIQTLGSKTVCLEIAHDGDGNVQASLKYQRGCFNAREVLSKLNGRTFESYQDLREELLEIRLQHLTDLPPGTGPVALYDLMVRNGWVHSVGQKISVQVK